MINLQDWYPLGFGDVVMIALTLKERLGAELYVREGNGMGLGFSLLTGREEIIINFTPWRQPSNMILDISYVVLCIIDADATTQEDRVKSARYYYCTSLKMGTFNNAEKLDHLSGQRQIWSIPKLIDKLHEFILDARRPADEREYKIGDYRDGYGQFAGGVAQVGADWQSDWKHGVENKEEVTT